MRPLLLLACAALLGGCLKVSFRRPATLQESLKEAGLRDYYLQVKSAFALGDEAAVSALFCGRGALVREGPARLRVEKLEFLDLGYQHALVRLRYTLERRSGAASFDERHTFTQRSGRWLMTSWEKE